MAALATVIEDRPTEAGGTAAGVAALIEDALDLLDMTKPFTISAIRVRHTLVTLVVAGTHA